MRTNPLVAMENTLFGEPALDWDGRCAAIAAAGFDGVYATPYPLTDGHFAGLADLATAPMRHGLRLAGVYANHDLAFPPDHPVNERTTRLIAQVEGVTRIELSFKCSDPAALPTDLDRTIEARLTPLLALAERRSLDLALYHHSFYPLETPAQTLALIQRLGHPRLKLLFATSHVFAVSPIAAVAEQLSAVAPHLVSFNLCGCRRSAPGPRAKATHLACDDGDLPLAPLLRILDQAEYRGDIILQGHGWGQDGRRLLARSRAWLMTV